jgi:hypothetical protein
MEPLGEIGRGLDQAIAQLGQYNAGRTAGAFTVTKDNVLAAAKIISTQADALEEKLRRAQGELTIVAPGEDDVSTRIAPAWNDLLVDNPDSYVNRITEYIDSLRNLAKQCADSARAYGYTDAEVAAVFGIQGA